MPGANSPLQGLGLIHGLTVLLLAHLDVRDVVLPRARVLRTWDQCVSDKE